MIELRNRNGVVKKAPQGFSWTVFFFGLFVPLFRKDWKFFLIMFALNLVIGAITYGLGAFIVNLIVAIKYNEWYLEGLQNEGYDIIR